MLFRKIIAMAVCAAMLLPLCACGDSKEQKQVFAMDTVMTLTAYGKNARTGLDAATGVINSLNTLLDPEVENSAAYLLNNADGQNVIVTPQVAEILTTALKVCKQSNGALDLSVYPLYLAWGEFDSEKGKIPSSKEIKELLKNVRFSETSITEFNGESNYSVRMPAGTQISFGAAAKGCASDRAIEAMRNAGVESGIVSLGGNVQTLGLKPDGSKWTVAVEDPNDTGSYIGTLKVGETEKFDEAYKSGLIYRVMTTNLVYQPEELLQREYYIDVDMSKYIALLIDTLNHDSSIAEYLNPTERIERILKKYHQEH